MNSPLNIYRKRILILIFGVVWLMVIVGFGSGYLPKEISDRIELPVTICIATITILLTFLEVQRNSVLLRASFVKDYISSFHTSLELKKTFHELIYLYKDTDFITIHDRAPIKVDDARLKLNEFYYCGKGELNDNKAIGNRYYHITRFQGSEEEKRLDSLLYFFDVIGYYHDKKLITMTDIYGTMGYFIELIRRKKCTAEYLKLIKSDSSNKENGISQFQYLIKLLEQFDEFTDRIKKENIRRRKEIRNKNT